MNDEAKIQEAARRLGEAAAERVDVEAAAQAVVQRLREPAPRPTWVQPAWLRIAAALVILVGGALVSRQLFFAPSGTAHGPAHFVTDDLTDLSADQLREVLSTLDETLDLGSTTQPDSGLEDLDAQQLKTVLRSLEG